MNNDFTPECMVRLKDNDNIERAISEMIELDQNDDAYLEKCFAPRLTLPWDFYKMKHEEFLLHIINQPLEKARRTVDYGRQATLRAELYRLYKQDDIIKKPYKIIRSILRKI